MKLFYFDLETTGLRHWKNGIHQISGAIEIDGAVKEYFNFHVKPYHLAIIEDEALSVAGITRADLDNYDPMNVVYCKLIALISKYVDKYNKTDKFYTVGYNNASFDNPFLRAFFVQNGDSYIGSWFWSCPIDAMVLAGQYLIADRANMENFQQSTVAKWLGIEVDETRLHEAAYDVEIMIQIYRIVSGGIVS